MWAAVFADVGVSVFSGYQCFTNIKSEKVKFSLFLVKTCKLRRKSPAQKRDE